MVQKLAENVDVVVYNADGRDGAQDPRSELNGKGRIIISKYLDEHNFPYFEAGYPEKNGEMKVFEELKKLDLTMKIVVFGSTKKYGAKVSKDCHLQAVLDANTPVVTLFGKTWLPHVKDVLGISHEQNLQIISESIDALKQAGKEAI